MLASRARCCKTMLMWAPAEMPPTETESGLMLSDLASARVYALTALMSVKHFLKSQVLGHLPISVLQSHPENTCPRSFLGSAGS